MQIVINGVLTNYEVINPKAKLSVLILHGWGQNSSSWLQCVNFLSDKYCYYLLDLPGFGATQNLSDNADVPEYTNFVKTFIEKVGLKKPIFIGHSFGGQVACDFALTYPNLLSELIFISPAIVRVRSTIVHLKLFITKIIKPINSLLPENIRKSILGIYAPKDYLAANSYQKTVLNKILRYNLGPKVHLIKTPTEIIWGSEDKVIPYMGKFLVENIPNAHLNVMYGCGHSPQITHPQKLASLLNQLLNK